MAYCDIAVELREDSVRPTDGGQRAFVRERGSHGTGDLWEGDDPKSKLLIQTLQLLIRFFFILAQNTPHCIATTINFSLKDKMEERQTE